MGAKPSEQGIVVEHLLEMRHEPYGIDRITMKSAAELIVDPPARHLAERRRDHLERVIRVRASPIAQQEIEGHRLRKLRRTIEPAVSRVEPLRNAAVCAVEYLGRQLAG